MCSKVQFLIICLRSLLLYISFVLAGLTLGTVGNIYAIFANKKQMTNYISFGAKVLLKLFHIIIGVKLEIRGRENIIKGPCIVASKHQSAYEAVMLFNQFYPRLAYAMKQEIGGQFFYLKPMYRKYDGIPINRNDGAKALIKMEKGAIEKLKSGRQFAIFPEGTRVPFGSKANFKKGVARIYAKANAPVVPVALNTGATWPKKGFIFYPGKIILEFLPAIEPGLSQEEFLQKLQTTIQTATAKLEEETPCNYYLKKEGLCKK